MSGLPVIEVLELPFRLDSNIFKTLVLSHTLEHHLWVAFIFLTFWVSKWTETQQDVYYLQKEIPGSLPQTLQMDKNKSPTQRICFAGQSACQTVCSCLWGIYWVSAAVGWGWVWGVSVWLCLRHTKGRSCTIVAEELVSGPTLGGSCLVNAFRYLAFPFVGTTLPH